MNKINYKYNIGDIITDVHSGKLQILEQIRMKNGNCGTRKGYKYKCLNCGNEDKISESDLKHKYGCNVCCHNPQKVLKGVNDIATTDPWMLKSIVNIEDAYNYTAHSSKSILFKCLNCGETKKKRIQNFYIQGISCNKCGDGFSYAEKLIYPILKQLQIKFQTQLSKTTFKWCDKYRYDFYFELNNEAYIIEANGLQHYEECTGNWKNKLNKQKEIDQFKKQLALKNGIKEDNYIVIDCRYSELEWIKNHILKSRLNELFNLSQINWLECLKFINKSLVQTVCKFYKSNKDKSIQDIANKFDINKCTVTDYLKKGNTLGWCNYDAKKQQKISGKRNGRINGKKSSKPVNLFKDNVFLNKFESAKELERQSEKIFGYKVSQGSISSLCKNNKIYKQRYIFKYA